MKSLKCAIYLMVRMVTVVHRDTIIPVKFRMFQPATSTFSNCVQFSVGKEHVHHNHISRSSTNDHVHDIHERKQMKTLVSQAKADFATMMHNEKRNVKYVKKGHPEAFHNMVFR